MTPHPARYARHPLPKGEGKKSRNPSPLPRGEGGRRGRPGEGLLLTTLPKNLTQKVKLQTSSLLVRSLVESEDALCWDYCD